MRPIYWLLLPALLAVACDRQQASDASDTGSDSMTSENSGNDSAGGSGAAEGAAFQVAPGLDARILTGGSGPTAKPGDLAQVHYTGWLFDDAQDGNRGDKFDSSVDRGQPFEFPLGAGRVIQGWDRGVEGMRIGETRELTIAPEMGYGERGAGAVIPPGATLVFEVELLNLKSNEE